MLAPLERFSDADQCVEFLTSTNDEKQKMLYFLILSGTHESSEVILKTIHDFPNIISIYILKEEIYEDSISLLKNDEKIYGRFTAIACFYEQLKQRMLQSEREHEQLGFDVWHGTEMTPVTLIQRKNKQEAMFMYGQLLKLFLLDTYETEDVTYDDAFKKMISFFRQSYPNSRSHLDFIERLQSQYKNYTPIYWYALDSFLYRLVNKALREHDVELLVEMRIFIRDLHQQIVHLYENEIRSENTMVPSTVYRGVLMPVNEFEKKILNHTGGLLSVNSFLSTTSNKELALAFAGTGQIYRNEMAVLFAISLVHDATTSAPFAFADPIIGGAESEYLLTMGTVYRIRNIEHLADNGIPCVHLLLTSDNDPQLTSLTNYTYRSIRDTDERFLTYIGAILNIMGDHGKAAEFYKIFLENINLDDGKRATALHNLGSCYTSAGLYTTAINYFLQALALKQENHRPLEETLCNLGVAYAHLK
ncbi:unnamed protein product [Rotaria sp. Silwood2]|nr:unnamed protein product [Rotaria sp. Silwood2]CAF3509825.1 unnamed protein product [Rotaria sp. Silwood2]CAF4640229.1 unnamed protein product [Rotaria sp. Silwood2]